MADLNKLERDFQRVQDVQPAVEKMLEEASDNVLCKGSNITLGDLVKTYEALMTDMAEVLMERSATAPALEEAILKAVNLATKQAAEAAAAVEGLPDGSMCIQPVEGVNLDTATVLVLDAVPASLLKKAVAGLLAHIMGGTNDILKAAGLLAPRMKVDYYGASHGFKGAPHLGQVIVTKVDSTGLRKAAGPVVPEAELGALLTYLSRAALSAKRGAQVNLTGPGLDRR
jgi:hypothetical protein